jgi:hypothetical protein
MGAPSPAAAFPEFQPIAILPPREWQAIMPLNADRVRVGFDASVMVMRLIDRAKQVLRHKYPEGRLEDIMQDALELLLDRKDPQRRLALKRGEIAVSGPATEKNLEPRFLRDMRAGRYISAKMKDVVWERDEGRCAWRFSDGTRCGSKELLEYDHIRPFAKGGRTEAGNLRLVCRMHNSMAAEAAGLTASPTPASGTSASVSSPPAADSPA